jgi:hypothetical protein
MGVGVVVATDDEGPVLVAPAAHADVELRGAHFLVDKDDRALGGLALRLVDDGRNAKLVLGVVLELDGFGSDLYRRAFPARRGRGSTRC